MGRSASHSCCQTTAESPQTDLVQPHAGFLALSVAVLATIPSILQPELPPSGDHPVEKLDHSPPWNSFSPSVLRI
jgi:hypothetical protein